MKPTIITVLATVLIATQVSAQSSPQFPVTTTFDGGLDGWEATGTEFVYLTNGGNPDGYLRHNDSTGDSNTASAPPRFLGDWSSINETGVIIFDHHVFTTGNGSPRPYRVFLSGPGGTARWSGALPTLLGSWVNIRVPIQQSEWIVESGTWAGLLNNVTSFKIQVELFVQTIEGPRDQNGIDNVYLGREEAVGELPDVSISFKPVVTFLSQVGTTYRIESSEDMILFTPLATIEGNGFQINYTDVRQLGTKQFYRVSIVE